MRDRDSDELPASKRRACLAGSCLTEGGNPASAVATSRSTSWQACASCARRCPRSTPCAASARAWRLTGPAGGRGGASAAAASTLRACRAGIAFRSAGRALSAELTRRSTSSQACCVCARRCSPSWARRSSARARRARSRLSSCSASCNDLRCATSAEASSEGSPSLSHSRHSSSVTTVAAAASTGKKGSLGSRCVSASASSSSTSASDKSQWS
mmetsp:Transcript_51255/g.147161  ORF Transcript_51255/g.147161 Transcript_51255/m.147161 type:complete len:214 (-) Transcript_51255:133-774(-)